MVQNSGTRIDEIEDKRKAKRTFQIIFRLENLFCISHF